MTSFYPGGGIDPQSAFADALARARQIAAKISNPTPEAAAEAAALKRPFEDSQPEAKKPAVTDPITAQLRSIADQQSRSSQAIQAAAAAASQINQKLGTTSGPPQPPLGGIGVPPQIGLSSMDNDYAKVQERMVALSNGSGAFAGESGGGMGPSMGLGPRSGLGAVVNMEYNVPDRMVGLIIGKGGEQIASIQAESGCKIQFAPDSGGMPDRPCTLTGTQESIEKAQELISQIISRGQGAPDPTGMGDGNTAMVEIMIPGNKVGLVIGKGGETIRQLQERAGVKMVMIQDSNQPTNVEKPLRISGENMKCQRAKDMVMDLITEKELESMQHGGFNNSNEYGGGMPGGKQNSMEIRVPRTAVGVVIGKGGDMIKKIQQETGARVQFMPDDGQAPERTCNITGPPDKMQEAASMIQDLINSAMNRQGPPGMGRGRGRGRGDGSRFDRGGPGGGRGRGGFDGPGGFPDETNYTVPADKCGLVIGKGGETIREINRQSGAFVELQRQPSANPGEKVFTVRGNPNQIQHAIQLICEKAGLPPPPPGGPGGPGPGGPGGPGPQGPGAPPGGPSGYDQYGQQYNQQYGQQNQGQQPPQSYTPQGWGGGYQQWQNAPSPSDPMPDQDKPSQDPNAAAWAAYYAQYYNQPGAQQQPQQPQQQQPPQQPQQAQPQQTAVNPQTGQLDYSAAWAEYYRQQGMHYHAQAILAQAQGQQGPVTQAPPQ